MRDPPVGPLLDALQENDKAAVRRAVEGLEALAAEFPEVAEALDRRLRAGPRWSIAYALGRIARPSALCLEVLAGGLGSGDQDLRWATQLLLTDLGKRYPEVRERLQGLLRRGSATQRRMAVYCLRDVGAAGTGLADALLAAVRDPEPLVRVAAATTLAKAPEVGPAALEALRSAAAGDPDARVRNAAAFALTRREEVAYSNPGTPLKER